eukprot:1158576-Pelagomonas_calceolata.AAC.5
MVKPHPLLPKLPPCQFNPYRTTQGHSSEFVFDRVFGADTSQEAVFSEVAKPLIQHVVQGNNGCCFAYGQTGSAYSSAYSLGDMNTALKEGGCGAAHLERLIEYEHGSNRMDFVKRCGWQQRTGLSFGHFPAFFTGMHDSSKSRVSSAVAALKMDYPSICIPQCAEAFTPS